MVMALLAGALARVSRSRDRSLSGQRWRRGGTSRSKHREGPAMNDAKRSGEGEPGSADWHPGQARRNLAGRAGIHSPAGRRTLSGRGFGPLRVRQSSCRCQADEMPSDLCRLKIDGLDQAHGCGGSGCAWADESLGRQSSSRGVLLSHALYSCSPLGGYTRRYDR